MPDEFPFKRSNVYWSATDASRRYGHWIQVSVINHIFTLNLLFQKDLPSQPFTNKHSLHKKTWSNVYRYHSIAFGWDTVFYFYNSFKDC